LAILVGLLCIAFVLREFTPPWQVGRELEKHTNKLNELESKVQKTGQVGTRNTQAIEANRKAIERNVQAIQANRREIQQNKARLKRVETGTQETVKEFRALYDQLSRENKKLAGKVKQLEDKTRSLEDRINAIEKMIREARPAEPKPKDLQ